MVSEVPVRSEMVPWLLGWWQGRSIMVEGHSGANLLMSRQPGSKAKAREEGPRDAIYHWRSRPHDLLPPTPPHLLIAHSAAAHQWFIH
jgi:hypothetical protein